MSTRCPNSIASMSSGVDGKTSLYRVNAIKLSDMIHAPNLLDQVLSCAYAKLGCELLSWLAQVLNRATVYCRRNCHTGRLHAPQNRRIEIPRSSSIDPHFTIFDVQSVKHSNPNPDVGDHIANGTLYCARQDIQVRNDPATALDVQDAKLRDRDPVDVRRRRFTFYQTESCSNVQGLDVQIGSGDARLGAADAGSLTAVNGHWHQSNKERDHARERRRNCRPSTPVEDAILAQPPALGHTIQHAHSLIPLWIGRHSAMRAPAAAARPQGVKDGR